MIKCNYCGNRTREYPPNDTCEACGSENDFTDEGAEAELDRQEAEYLDEDEDDDDWISEEESGPVYFKDGSEDWAADWDGEPWDDPYEDWNYESDYVEKVGTGE